MNQEKFGKFIKELRQKHNLTQKEFADKYHVTYQAVSKWENGKNMPDSSLIKQISEDFNISLEELYNGEFKPNKKNKKIILITLLIILTLSLFIIALTFSKQMTLNLKPYQLTALILLYPVTSLTMIKNQLSIFLTLNIVVATNTKNMKR